MTVLLAGRPLGTGAKEAERPRTTRQSIVINSASSNIDYETNTAEFKDIVISQGDARLTAEQATATGVNFTNSEWTFVGRVVLSSEQRGSLRADQAILQFHEGELTQITATGSPAYIEQPRSDSASPGFGHADQITYDAKQETVRLSGHAQLSDGRREVSAPAFLYDVRDKGLRAESLGEKRAVHITIVP